MKLSECCGATPIGEVFDTIGFCSHCRDHAEFHDLCSLCTENHALPGDDRCMECINKRGEK